MELLKIILCVVGICFLVYRLAGTFSFLHGKNSRGWFSDQIKRIDKGSRDF